MSAMDVGEALTEVNIGNALGRRPSWRLLLEVLVKTELAGALCGVTQQRWHPVTEEACCALLCHDGAEAWSR